MKHGWWLVAMLSIALTMTAQSSSGSGGRGTAAPASTGTAAAPASTSTAAPSSPAPLPNQGFPIQVPGPNGGNMSTVSPSPNPTEFNTGTSQVNTNIPVTNTTGFTGGFVGGTAPVTPILTLGTASTAPVGATNGTANNIAGASDATIGNVPPAGSSVVTTPIISYQAGPGPTMVVPGYGASLEVARELAAEATSPAPMRGVFNMGAGSSSFGTPDGRSLGEVAAMYRKNQGQTQNAGVRMYTNDDIARLNQQPGVVIGSRNAANQNGAQQAAMPSSAYPANNGVIVTQPATTAEATTPQNPVQPSNSSQAVATSQASSGQSASDQQSSTQSVAQGNAAPANNQNKKSLPATATSLPAIALLGLLAAGFGVFILRRRTA